MSLYTVLAYLVLFTLVYLQTFRIGFLSDGFRFIWQCHTENWQIFSSNFHDYFYLPLTHTIAFFQFKIFGDHAVGFRLVQYGIHVLNAFLLFVFLKRFLQHTPVKPKQVFEIAAISGAFFLLNPYQTEGVVWLASRAYLWCTLFSLLALIEWEKYIRSKANKHLIPVFLFGMLAMFCKEMALTLPLIILGMEMLRNRRFSPVTRKIHLLWVFPVGIYIWARFFTLGEWIGGYGATVHFHPDINVWATHAAAYMAKFFVMARFLMDATGPKAAAILVSILLLAIAVYVVVAQKMALQLPVYQRFNRRSGAVWIGITAIALLPVLPLEMTSMGSIQSDRYSYFPLLFASVAMVWIIWLLAGKHVKWVATPVLVLFGMLTFQINQNWAISHDISENAIAHLAPQLEEGFDIHLFNQPDNYCGAYLFRNGLTEAVCLRAGLKKGQITPLFRQALCEAEHGVTWKMTRKKIHFRLANPQSIVKWNKVSPLYLYTVHENNRITLDSSEPEFLRKPLFIYSGGAFYRLE